MDRIGIPFHHVSLNLESNNPDLIRYASRHLHGLTCKPFSSPALQVRCDWHLGPWDPEENPFPSRGELNVIGKRMLGNDRELIWLNTLRMKGLKLRFRREDDGFVFDVSYGYHPKVRAGRTPVDYEYKRYFSLMSYLVYYPVFWYLENLRGWTPLHASALETSEGAIVICGLGGVGKTTSCVALVQHAGARLISENLVLSNGRGILPCYEPIRLNPESIDMLGDSSGLRRMEYPESLKEKTLYHLDSPCLSTEVEPALLFLPTFSPRRYVERLDGEQAAERVIAANRLTRELDDYYWYAGALELAWPRSGQSVLRSTIVHNLSRGVPCYGLGIDRNAGITAVVEDVMETLKNERRNAVRTR